MPIPRKREICIFMIAVSSFLSYGLMIISLTFVFDTFFSVVCLLMMMLMLSETEASQAENKKKKTE